MISDPAQPPHADVPNDAVLNDAVLNGGGPPDYSSPDDSTTGGPGIYRGDGAELLERYAQRLADGGVVRGLIGPREIDRLWDRHLLNCAAVAPLFPVGARVVDVGSGAGLPGVALACVRSDLRIDLVDSLHRRTDFLAEVVADLDFGDRVRVITGRAEQRATVDIVGESDWVTARAVAPLARLGEWCLPLLRTGGRLAALKGARAETEIREDSAALRQAGGVVEGIRQFPESGTALARVVLVRRESRTRADGRRAQQRRRADARTRPSASSGTPDSPKGSRT